MKKKMLALCLFSVGMLLCSCGTDGATSSTSRTGGSSETSSSGVTSQDTTSSSRTTVSSEEHSSTQTSTSIDKTVHVTSVSLNRTAYSLEEEETYQLYESISPWNATDRSVSWSTSDETVATVSRTGLITAIKKEPQSLLLQLRMVD